MEETLYREYKGDDEEVDVQRLEQMLERLEVGEDVGELMSAE
jgi:hypothetical protein